MSKKLDYPDQFCSPISDLFDSHCIRQATPDRICPEPSDLNNRGNKFVSLKVRGNSSLLVTENLCFVVDPGDQIMDLIEGTEIDYAIITHGHVDHHSGLIHLFKNGQSPTIICSRFTQNILRKFQIELTEIIHAIERAIIVDPDPFETRRIGGVDILACNGGHCFGNTMFFVKDIEGSHSILFAQESTLRLVGGTNANLPEEFNCEVLVVDGNCSTGSTSDVPSENHIQLLSLLQASFSTHQAVVILCNSLGIMQEVYSGVYASLYAGELAGKQVRLMNCPPVIRDELVKLTSSPTEIFPWDAQISFEDWTTQELLRYGKDAVVIVPAAIGDDGCATVDIHEFLKQKSLKVLAVNLNLPDLQEFDNFDNIAIPTHSSATEVDQLINHCNPNKVIFGCTGGTELSLQKKWPAVDFYNGVTKTATLHFNNANDCIEG
jgi:hypothetical protein